MTVERGGVRGVAQKSTALNIYLIFVLLSQLCVWVSFIRIRVAFQTNITVKTLDILSPTTTTTTTNLAVERIGEQRVNAETLNRIRPSKQ